MADLYDFADLGQKFSDMGNAVFGQLKDVLEAGVSDVEGLQQMEMEGELNGNALQYMVPWLDLLAKLLQTMNEIDLDDLTDQAEELSQVMTSYVSPSDEDYDREMGESSESEIQNTVDKLTGVS